MKTCSLCRHAFPDTVTFYAEPAPDGGQYYYCPQCARDIVDSNTGANRIRLTKPEPVEPQPIGTIVEEEDEVAPRAGNLWITICKVVAFLSVVALAVLGGVIMGGVDDSFAILGVLAGPIGGIVICSFGMVFIRLCEDVSAIRAKLEEED